MPLHAGRYTVAVTGVGSYAGKTATADFEIAAKDIADTQSGSGLVTVRVDDAVYDGTEKKPAVVVTYATRDGRVLFLTEGTDYTLLHSSNTNVGTAATQITGRGDYAGSREVAFQITAADGGKLDVAPLSPVVYSGMDQKPSLTVSAGGQNVGSYEATYTYNGGAVQDLADAAFVNAGTYVITVTAKDGNFNGAQGTATFVIRPAEISRTELDENALVYTGNPIEPRVTQVTAGAMEVPSTSHRVVYSNNQLVGTASVTVFSIDPNFTGSVTKEFQITGGSLYAVTYDGNGATGGNVPMDSSTYLAGNSVILLGNNEALERTDAVFVGWSTEKTELLTSEAQAAQVTIVRPGAMLQMPAGGLKVYAVWAQDGNQDGRPDYQETVTIIASAGPGGTISPSGSQAYAWGTASVKYAITVENGYSFAGVRVDGTQVAVSTPQAPTALAKNGDGTYTYTFGMLTGNHTIAATFQQLSGGGTGGGGAGGGSGAGGGAGTSGGAGGGGAGAGGGGAGGGGTAPPKPDAPDATKPLDPAGSGVEDWLETENHVAFLRGYPGSRFDPDRSMTRAEVAQLFYNLLLKRSVDVPAAFEDVAPDAWYAEAVSALAALGVLEGVGHGRFAPERNITRAEFAAIAMRFGKQQPDGENIFSDVSETDWYYGAVVNSIRYGWITGYPDGTFRPTSSITRSEVAVMVNRMLGRRADRTYIREHGGMLIGFKDLPERHWAYFDVMEAANSHDHRRQSDAEVWTGHHS